MGLRKGLDCFGGGLDGGRGKWGGGKGERGGGDGGGGVIEKGEEGRRGGGGQACIKTKRSRDRFVVTPTASIPAEDRRIYM